MKSPSRPHTPVLYQEVIRLLAPRDSGRYVDGTLGAGGHAYGILEASSPRGQLIGFDRDPQALELAAVSLSSFGDRVHLVHASFASLLEVLRREGWEQVNGILLDLGVSSLQLGTPQRGFSFQHDAPLDMRFDPTLPVTAADLVNTLSEDELTDLFYRYGEEPAARRIARAILQSRPIHTTAELARLIEKVKPHRGRIHPATQVFQALRIAVNRELEALEQVLPQAVQALVSGGRLVVIAFHSLEDRIVKEFFRRESQDCICPPRQPVCTCGHRATLHVLTPKPLTPTPQEIAQNPRARSARLRCAEKL
ncbi:MAG: 16S rRNA (cytosine(1402)-N(4))-methyltransferase RsmH [Anaerolineales bacterium]